MSEDIPSQLAEYPLVRVCRPDCRSHNHCNSTGKRPVTAADDPDPHDRIESWLARGGNYGVVPTTDNDLLIFDVDSAAMAEILSRKLPPTFTVQSGGAEFGQHWYYRCEHAADQRNWTQPEGGVRTDNWMIVAPGSTHGETGAAYEILDDSDIATISSAEYQAVYDMLTEIHESHTDTDTHTDSNSTTTVETAATPGATSATESAESVAIPGSLQFITSDEYRRKIADILHDSEAPHRDRLWLAGWLYGAAGLYPPEIVDLIHQECHWADYNHSITEKMVNSVARSSDSSRGTHPTETGHISPGETEFLLAEAETP